MWSLYEMPRRRLKLLISNVCILLSISAVNVQVSQDYENMDVTKERNSLIFELRSMFLSSQMLLSFVSAVIVWAILERISGMDPSSVTMAPNYLKLWTVFSFSPLILMLLLMPLVLLVINLVYSALICMPYAVKVSSRRSTRLANCNFPSLPGRLCHQQNVSLRLPCLHYWLSICDLQVQQPWFSPGICWRGWVRADSPVLLLTVVLNQFPELPLKQTALMALS